MNPADAVDAAIDRGVKWTRPKLDLIFGPDDNVLPARYLFALIGNAAACFVIARLLTDDDCPNDLGDE